MTSIAQWRDMWAALGLTSSDTDLYNALLSRYREPHRHYHTLQHLDECLALLPALRPLAEQPAEIELALWFHDAIYELQRQDNELRSAEWARSAVQQSGLSNDCAERIHALVMATRHSAVPEGIDARILVDIDLSILGAAPQRFDEYERQVRAEYAWVPEPQFRDGRRGILEQFLARPTIFNTDYFLARFEHSARANLERSLRKLRV